MRRPRRFKGSTIAAECSAFLSGEAAALLESRGRIRPCWAWLNALAHGPESDLERQARSLGRPSTRGRWETANAFLAGELLATSRRGSSMEALQSDVLVPLELDLLAGSAPAIRTPAEYVSSVLDLLESHEVAVMAQQRRLRS
jgi:hypothetical protein